MISFDNADASPSLLLSNPKTAALITKMLEGQLQGSGSSAAVVKSTPTGGPALAKDAEVEGQLVEVKFPAKKAGRYNLQLMCMSGMSPSSQDLSHVARVTCGAGESL